MPSHAQGGCADGSYRGRDCLRQRAGYRAERGGCRRPRRACSAATVPDQEADAHPQQSGAEERPVADGDRGHLLDGEHEVVAVQLDVAQIVARVTAIAVTSRYRVRHHRGPVRTRAARRASDTDTSRGSRLAGTAIANAAIAGPTTADVRHHWRSVADAVPPSPNAVRAIPAAKHEAQRRSDDTDRQCFRDAQRMRTCACDAPRHAAVRAHADDGLGQRTRRLPPSGGRQQQRPAAPGTGRASARTTCPPRAERRESGGQVVTDHPAPRQLGLEVARSSR